mmetsp:Transcript_23100/g.42542  ORF Transcript_23100/g.42542 Transcript_23100/m.42542 type:complete len:84 (-) Transcript_23100:54-305(-)
MYVIQDSYVEGLEGFSLGKVPTRTQQQRNKESPQHIQCRQGHSTRSKTRVPQHEESPKEAGGWDSESKVRVAGSSRRNAHKPR